jgi:EAL domain-containing protein (putative c-di-GMP-specific phosphodiesterase class I)
MDSFLSSIRKHQLDAASFSFEIAQTALPKGGQDFVPTLQAAASSGISFTIDDFGTGQFDLALLRQLPIGKLKIDRGFLTDIAVNEEAAIVVQALAAMAGGLGLAFAADGVENAAQLARLQALGCDEWQGPHFSAPLDAAAFVSLLSSAAPRALSA